MEVKSGSTSLSKVPNAGKTFCGHVELFISLIQKCKFSAIIREVLILKIGMAIGNLTWYFY